MDSLLEMGDFESPCDIGFRVEVDDDDHWRRNSTLDSCPYMMSRNPDRRPDLNACHDHLTWRKVTTPFISFFTNWDAALRRRQMMIDEGAKKAVILAVWLDPPTNVVLDAHGIAKMLGLKDDHLYEHEVLVWRRIPSASNYYILAMFHGTQKTETAALSIDCPATAQMPPIRMTVITEIPGNFVAGVRGRWEYGDMTLADVTDRLRGSVYAQREPSDPDLELLTRLIASIGDVPYTVSNGCDDTRVTMEHTPEMRYGRGGPGNQEIWLLVNYNPPPKPVFFYTGGVFVHLK